MNLILQKIYQLVFLVTSIFSFSQFLPFAKGNDGSLFSFQNDGDLTIGCLFDKNCDKKVWIQVEKTNGEKTLTNGYLKCASSEFDYDYIVKYDKNGKQLLNKKIVKTEKIVPGTIIYKLYDYFCNEKEDGPAFSMNMDEVFLDTSYYVSVSKAYFYEKPDMKTRKSSYLVYGNQIHPINESKYYYFIEYENERGLITKGWILKSEIENQ